MLRISRQIVIPEGEIEINAVRAQGAGGQHVNKAATAAHLRFDIHASSLPQVCKDRLLSLTDQRVSKEGVIIIKAQQFRSLEQNKADARLRLQMLIKSVLVQRKKRKPSKPTAASKVRRLDQKNRHGRLKALRAKIRDE